ncbi:hypothetical protein [Sphingosinicella xenopeptidilytica]|uniref:Uncharacterized protein n=1 Tax=Sphingosinicella xenopeptidilytica TaxID=364098 RepID=A0ABW3C3D5_SPHXN
MSKAAFDKIAEGLQEALAVAKGKAKPFKVFGMPVVVRKSLPNDVIEFRHPDGRVDKIVNLPLTK